MEIDGDLEVVWIAIATGAFLDSSDLGVETLSDGIGDAMSEVGQDIRQMTGNQFGGSNHGCQAAVSRPEVPALPEFHRPCG